MRTLLAFVVLACLSGCANLKFQFSVSYMNDNMAAEVERQRTQP